MLATCASHCSLHLTKRLHSVTHAVPEYLCIFAHCLALIQVLTTKQLAEMMVHCYPYMPSMEPFIHSLAAETRHPAKEDIVAAAQTNHMANEWKQFNEYAKYAATDIFHHYVAFLKGRPDPCSRTQSVSRDLSAEALPAERSRYIFM